jgi:hypothetical protein
MLQYGAPSLPPVALQKQHDRQPTRTSTEQVHDE